MIRSREKSGSAEILQGLLVLHQRSRPAMDEAVAPISRSAVVWASSPALLQTGQPCFLSPHGFTRTENWTCFVSGHGFSRADSAHKKTWALAPAESILRIPKNIPATGAEATR
jgi:hypothetical protein